MHVLFDEGGKFLAGRILSEAEASAQVELDSGKRLKVKAANQLLRFEKPAPAELLAQAQAQAFTGDAVFDAIQPGIKFRHAFDRVHTLIVFERIQSAG